ncbi:Chaperone protein DnaJ [Novipirellula aureliae]|uniref:Chaperone protein DnaJ n=1 Tax=Novipirellula aureliae TaxID=2527966 RepID=A0A5C6DNL7_9BACT|nr:molecular chaperone DnaJ [Novipirellula aureliae]TWU37785.1 Chaperone protein DnaJ [Novipirellula aureliae]
MAEKRDYYEVLQVTRTAGKGEIDRAYRKLAIKFHPDSNRNDEDAVAKFKEASEAYEILSDQEKRERYDRFGHAGVDGAAHQFNDVEDIFEAFGDLFGGGVFGNMFGGGGGRGGGRRRSRRGADIRCNVTLTLEEAARGVSKEVSFRRRVRCGTCSGSGAAPGSQPETCATCGGQGQVIQSAGILRVQTACPHCHGSGQQISQKCGDCQGSGLQQEKAELTVEIPAGVDDGMRVRLQNEGEASPDGGPPGDCYCFISVLPHALFKREGNHLVLQLPISYTQAALGADIEVPTLDGPNTLRVEAGTQTGEVFTLKGEGIADPRGGRPGDLLVQVFIEVPKKLSADQEKLLRSLAEMERESVLPHRKTFLEKLKTFFEPDETPQT